MFNKDSALVKIWVRLIQQKLYNIEDISNLSNLKEIVLMELNNENGDDDQVQKAEAFDYLTGRGENNE